MANNHKKEKLDQNTSISSLKLDQDLIAQFDSVQQDIDRLNDESGQAIIAIEQKYVRMRQPYFQKREEHISKIPNFWLAAFSNHPQVSEIITEEEEKALAYLKRLEVQDFDDIKTGYKINFYFNENPFFTNKLLTRQFKISEDGLSTVTASPINWKPGKCLTSEGKQTGVVKFFDWYSSKGRDNFDEIGEAIKEEIWANPLHFFLMEEEGMDEEEGEDAGSEGDNGVGEDDENGDEDGEGEDE